MSARAATCNLVDQNLTDDTFATWLSELHQPHEHVELRLDRNQLTERSLERLARSSHIGTIVGLVIGHNPIGDAGATIVSSQPTFGAVEWLSLPSTQLSSVGVGALVSERSVLEELMILDVSGNSIGDEGVELIANSPRSAWFYELSLTEVGMTDRGARALANSAHLSRLKSLSCGSNALSEEAVAMLRSCERFHNRFRLSV